MHESPNYIDKPKGSFYTSIRAEDQQQQEPYQPRW